MNLDRRIQRHQRDGEVGSVGGDAVVACAEHGVPAVFAANGGAARARRALVAVGVADVAKIWAPSALEQITAHGRLVANLRAGRVQQRLGDDGILLHDGRMSGYVRHGGARADPEILRSNLDAVVEQSGKADQPFRPAHVFLEQLNHIGAAGDVLCGSVVAAGLRLVGEGSGQIARTFESEGMHLQPFGVDRVARAASWIAATMWSYAPQRQRLPLIHSRISCAEAAWPSAMQAAPAMICPGVQ